MTKKNIFRFLSIIVVFAIIMPITKLEVPVIQRFQNIAFLWFFAVLFLKPKLLIHKAMLVLYFAFIVNLIIWASNTNQFSYNYNTADILRFIYPYMWIALAVNLNLYFIKSNDYEGFIKIINISFILILLTSITSILGLNSFPNASRSMNQGTMAIDYNLHNYYSLIGIAGYGFYTMVMILIPIIVFLIKKTKTKLWKFLFYLFLLIFIYSTYKAQHTTILIFAIVGFIIAHIKLNKNFFLKLSLAVIFVAVSSVFLSELIYSITEKMEASSVVKRLNDIAFTLDNGFVEDSYFVSERLGRTQSSIDLFFINPIFGSGESSGHAYWIDRLALIGIIGFLFYANIFVKSYKFNSNFFSHSISYYQLIYFIIIIFGVIKNMSSFEIWFTPLFFAPCILWLENSKSKKLVTA